MPEVQALIADIQPVMGRDGKWNVLGTIHGRAVHAIYVIEQGEIIVITVWKEG